MSPKNQHVDQWPEAKRGDKIKMSPHFKRCSQIPGLNFGDTFMPQVHLLLWLTYYLFHLGLS